MRPLLALALLLPCARASAFTGKIHEELNRQAVKEMGYDAVAVDAVTAGNLLTDKDEGVGGEFWTAAAHFDNEQLAAGSKRMKEKILQALKDLDGCDPAAAREQLGRVLHSTQDFFAHSNWIENHAFDEKVDLLSLSDPGKDVICLPGSHKGPLTSGYYFRDDKQAAPPGKCLHNGELHKDDPSRRMHADARAKALAQSREILALFDRLVSAKYGPSASGEAAFRLRLLKIGASSEKERAACRPHPAAAGPTPLPKILEVNPWHP